jgi:GTPase SAR1 family protein
MHFQVQGMWLVYHSFRIFSIQDGSKICFLFHSNKNQHKDDHEDQHKEGEQKYEHKDEHTISIEISMVKEGDIVVSIWDLVGQDEYHAIK